MPPQPARKDLLRYSACALAVFAIAISGLSAHAAVKAKSDKRAGADYFTIAQIRYGGGGDWYEDKTAMYRLQARIEKEFGIPKWII